MSKTRRGYVKALGLALLAVSLLPVEAAQAAATRAEYVVQADPICAAANQDIKRLNRRYHALHRKGERKRAGQVLERTGPRLSRSVAEVRSIPPPPGDEVRIAQWLDLIQGVADNNVQMGRAHRKGNFRRQARLEADNDDLRRQAHLLVDAFGFQDCA